MLILKEEWQSHQKILKAVYLAGSKTVKHFWFDMISRSANGGGDGIIEPFEIFEAAESVGIDADTAEKFLQALLNSGTRAKPSPLFHDAESLKKCAPCKDALAKYGHRPDPGDIVVHDFFDHNPAAKNKTPLGQAREKRKNWLKRGNGAKLKEEVYARDRGLCRYCGIRPNDDGGESRRSLSFDHLDPDPLLEPNNGNFLDNLCVACIGCNRQKGERTREEAGMRTLAIGITIIDVQAGRAVYVDDLSETAPATTEVTTDSPDPDAPDGVGSGAGQGRRRGGHGSGGGRARVGAGAPSTPRPRTRVPQQAATAGARRPESLPP